MAGTQFPAARGLSKPRRQPGPPAKRGLLSSARAADDIFCNCIRKTYPDGSSRVMVADRAVWRVPGYEPVAASAEKKRRGHILALDVDFDPDPETAYEIAERGGKADECRAAAALDRAKRRAKSAVRDLAYSNDFRYFVTLTLDQSKIDRYDMKEITRHLNHWLDNHVRRSGLRYVLVAERHKDGAVHFHGFFNDALTATDSGHKDRGGHRVYNLPSWGWGFSTAIELYGDKHKAVGYVVKYITKAQEKIGGRWYYSGGDLQRPRVDYLVADFEAISCMDACVFEVGTTGARCAVVDVEGGVTDGGEAAATGPAPGADGEAPTPKIPRHICPEWGNG